jgi:hypothetical protein
VSYLSITGDHAIQRYVVETAGALAHSTAGFRALAILDFCFLRLLSFMSLPHFDRDLPLTAWSSLGT